MKRRRIGYAAWLALAVCLYFFENNTGTRVILACSALIGLIPPLRAAMFSPDEARREETREYRSARDYTRREDEEAGDIRPYRPGDPVRRIHWKLSAKKDEVLIRDTAAGEERTEKEKAFAGRVNNEKPKAGKRAAAALAAGAAVCGALVPLIPEARRGAQELCNRLFAASENINNYTYRYFTVPGEQSVYPAVILLICAAALLTAAAAVSRSRAAALGIMAGCTLFQAYFGLAFPDWANIPLYGLIGLWMMKRPAGRKNAAAYCACLLLCFTAVWLLLPGTDAATETASEKARDFLARMMEQVTGTAAEIPEGETETRHIHTRTLENGPGEAETEREFRLVTEGEEQISRPEWLDWIRVILLSVLAVAAVTVPFLPFLLLNARKKKARETREAFEAEDTGEAVQAIFRQTVRLLEAVGRGEGNLLYREWGAALREGMPEAYAQRFARCAADYEEAAYSSHAIPEEKRRRALELLKETENTLWEKADRKQRMKLKYRMCLRE